MNIFIIARGYPTAKDSTWGCFEKDQADALASIGHKITILSVDVRFRSYWRPFGIQHHTEGLLSIYNIFLIPYIFLFFVPKRLKDGFYTWQLERIYKRAVIKQGKPDIIYTHYLYNTHKVIPIHKKYNIPTIAIEHCSQMGYHPIPKTAIQLAQQTYPYVDQLLTVSSSLKDNIYNELGFDSIVVPNIVGKEFFYLSPTQTNDTIKIVSIGRIVQGKRFDLLIQAVNQINIPYELNIIGNGPELHNLQLLIDKLQAQDKIHLLGNRTKEEIASILHNSNIFVLPSQSETFGVAYIEALACGLPIIATDCGGPRDIVTNKNGLLIPVNDINALLEAITSLINNLHIYNRREIAEDCKKRFSSQVIANQLIKIFEDTVKKYKEHQ